jgi:hypothetical protein
MRNTQLSAQPDEWILHDYIITQTDKRQIPCPCKDHWKQIILSLVPFAEAKGQCRSNGSEFLRYAYISKLVASRFRRYASCKHPFEAFCSKQQASKNKISLLFHFSLRLTMKKKNSPAHNIENSVSNCNYNYLNKIFHIPYFDWNTFILYHCSNVSFRKYKMQNTVQQIAKWFKRMPTNQSSN